MKFFLLNTEGSAEGRLRFLSKHPTLLFIMRVSFLYIVIMIGSLHLLLASHGKGQNLDEIKVTVSLDNDNLETLFKTIQAQTGLLFTFFPEQVDAYTGISLPKATRSVKATLDLALNTTPLTYRQVNNNVIILKQGTGEEDTTGSAALLNESTPKITRATITGTVTDGKTQQPMAGVNIIVKGTTRGTTTDTQGKFAIDAEDKEVLVFSFIGFKTFEANVSALMVIDVAMEEDMNALQEVVISGGYYLTTDRMKTGNIAKVTAKDIENQPVTSLLMALQGKVPGLDITPYNGTPGSAVKIQIRGQNSLRWDGAFPLYIIDGVPIDSRPLESASSSLLDNGSDPLSSLNPSNIESIEILKDADATAIYGSRGANGVILITTKQAAKSGATNLSLNAYMGIGKMVNRMKLLNTEQYLSMRHEAFTNDGVSPGLYDFDLNGDWDQNKYTDWQDELLGGTARISDMQASITGGNSNTSFRLSGGFHKENVIYSDDFGYKRVVGNFSLNHLSSNKRFRITLSTNYGASRNRLFEGAGFVSSALTLPPNAPELYDEEGNLNWDIRNFGTFKLNGWSNPLQFLKRTHDAKNGNLIANSTLSYEIASGLSLKTSLGFNELNGKELLKFPIDARSPIDIFPTTTGSSTFGRNNRQSWIIEPQLSYIKSHAEHNLNAILGATWQENNSEYQSVKGLGYSSDVLLNTLRGATSTVITEDEDNQYRYTALFTRIGYSFRGRYFLNLTGRRDGSSRFGPGNRLANFGAIGAAWIFSSEAFIRNNLTFLNFGKLRASYGTTGNDQIGDYKFYDTYSISKNTYQGGVSLSPTALFNPNFKWEVTYKQEAALELGLFENRLSMELSWYRNRSSNQLVSYQLPATTGFGEVLSNLDATVENSGWEATMSFQSLNTPSLKWATVLNFSLPRNKLIDFPGISESPYANQYKIGESLSIRRLYTWKGLNQATGEHEILDISGDGNITTDDLSFMDPTDRKCYGGINNTINFKSVELSFLLQFSKQEKAGYTYTLPGVPVNMPARVLDRWTNEGDNTNIGKFSRSNANLSFYTAYVNASNYSNSDASFIRLKTLSLSYLLPLKIIDKSILQEVKIFIQGQNLLTLTNYLGLDPETGTNLPPLKMVTSGVQLKF